MCSECKKRFAVAYHQVDPDEPMGPVPVRCPHCGLVNRILVAASAATSAQFWTEKIGS